MRQAGAKLLRAENTSTKSVDQTNEERMQENSLCIRWRALLRTPSITFCRSWRNGWARKKAAMSTYAPSWMFQPRRLIPQLQQLFSRSVRVVIYVRSMLFAYAGSEIYRSGCEARRDNRRAAKSAGHIGRRTE